MRSSAYSGSSSKSARAALAELPTINLKIAHNQKGAFRSGRSFFALAPAGRFGYNEHKSFLSFLVRFALFLSYIINEKGGRDL